MLASPWLGPAKSSQLCDLKGGACRQAFAGGWMVQSPAGAYAVPGAVISLWNNWGRERGIIGFPTSAPSADPSSGEYTQSFQGGVVTVSGGVARLSSTTDPWFSAVLASPWLGQARSSQLCDLLGGACRQEFAGGWMVQSPAGAYAVPTTVLGFWLSHGQERGALGFPNGAPTANPESGNYTQSFQGGVVRVAGGVASF
ncbi:LGFP repeat-containing protein [Agromyces sp. CCNWLW203]|uniref:LGFP repeat-containing protein n=1 Tax=Agromyces sp. CCNWLW203 TaxID=3112842 RepID=UPI003FA52AC6